MQRRRRKGTSSSDSDGHRMVNQNRGSGGGGNHHPSDEGPHNIRTKPPKIYDNLTRKLMQFGIVLGVTTFIGLIVRYAVQEFDPSVSTITVTTSRVDNRDIASLSVSKNFLERILEFMEESIAIVAATIPIGFPLCTLFNGHFAKIRAAMDKRIEINSNRVLAMIPKYVVIGDAQACQMPQSTRLRPLVRDTIYQLIKSRLKPKLIVEDSYEEARKLGIRIGLIRREHHRLAVIKSVDLLRNITDSRGDIKQAKVRYLLSRMKIMSQATPADKSLLIYLMKHCESRPNENLAYLGYSFTDPEAMRIADCAISFADCDDDDVKREAQVLLKSESMTFTDLYLLLIVCSLSSNIIQSYALYQISASIACCLYRFLSITVFQEQLISYSQFSLLIMLQQILAIAALMTKWLSSLPQAPLKSSSAVTEMSHAVTEDHVAASAAAQRHHTGSGQHQQQAAGGRPHRRDPHAGGSDDEQEAGDDTLDSSSSLESLAAGGDHFNADHQAETRRKSRSQVQLATSPAAMASGGSASLKRMPAAHRRTGHRHSEARHSSGHIHLSGVDLDQAVINSKLVSGYKQTFHNSDLVDDVTYRLAKLHIAYQVLVMIIIMIFGNAMFQLNMNNNRQHQTLAFNSLIMNNIFNLCNCFNQLGEFNLRSGLRSHPFFVCVLLLAIFVQVSLTELNAFGLENLSPIQWFVCFVFATLSALIAPLTGQQQQKEQNKHPDLAAGKAQAPAMTRGAPKQQQATRVPGAAQQQKSRKH